MTAARSARPHCIAAVAHADAFAAALPSSAAVVDLGSGGGLPGLVIAVRRPDLRLTLVERRAHAAPISFAGA